jgi:hypothetical protein
MNARIVLAAFLLAAIVSPAAPLAGAQLEEDGTRAAFIKERPTARVAKQRPPRTKARPKTPPVATTKGPETPVVPVAHAEPVGLGFSLYQVFDKTRSRRVVPAGVFRGGDQVRFVLESSIDGYLYVFLITHDKKTGAKRPRMIYPDARLEGGDNFVYAHTATEVPSRRNPQFDIFGITGGPGTEQLFFVVSRDPLQNVPIGEELVELCARPSAECPWSPAGSLWEPLERQASAEVRTSVRRDAGKEVSRGEEVAIATRDMVLGSSDDAPSVIAVNASSETPLLVRQVELRHE